MADTIIENLVTRLSFRTDPTILESFLKFLKKAKKGLTALVSIAASAATAIGVLSKKVADANTDLLRFSRRINVGVDTIQELGFAAEMSGGSVNSINSSLENLTRISSQAARGIGGGVEAFGILGVHLADANGQLKTADVLFQEVSNSLSRMQSQAMRLEFAQRVGISPDLLPLIQQGSTEIVKLREEAKRLGIVVDVYSLAASERFTKSLKRLFAMFRHRTILSGFTARLTPIVEAFSKWLEVNRFIIRENINKFLGGTLKVMTALWNISSRVVSVVNDLIKIFGGWKNAIIITTSALITLNATALLMPALWLAAGLAIFLVLEDIVKYSKNADSQLGALVKKYEGIKKIIDAIIKVNEVAQMGAGLKVGRMPKSVAEFAAKVAVGIREMSIQYDLNPQESPLVKIKEELGALSVLQKGKNEQAVAEQNLTNTNTRNVTININGGDTDKIKQVVKDELGNQFSSAQSNLSSAVER